MGCKITQICANGQIIYYLFAFLASLAASCASPTLRHRTGAGFFWLRTDTGFLGHGLARTFSASYLHGRARTFFWLRTFTGFFSIGLAQTGTDFFLATDAHGLLQHRTCTDGHGLFCDYRRSRNFSASDLHGRVRTIGATDFKDFFSRSLHDGVWFANSCCLAFRASPLPCRGGAGGGVTNLLSSLKSKKILTPTPPLQGRGEPQPRPSTFKPAS